MSWKPPEDEGDAIVLAIRVPLRRRLLAAIAERDSSPTSPRQLEQRFDETLQRIAYHVRCLNFYGLIDLADTQPVKGATQHFYKANDLGRRALVLARQTGLLNDKEVSDDGGSEKLDR